MCKHYISFVFLFLFVAVVPTLADVTVSVDEGTPGDGIAEVTLDLESGAVVRGIALKVTITGAGIDDVGDVIMPVLSGNLKWAYVDYYFTGDTYLSTITESDLPGTAAHPIADPLAAGVLDPTGGLSEFVISAGILDNDATQAGLEDDITIMIDVGASCTVCIEADVQRGGIVGNTLGTVTDSDCATIDGIICKGDANQDGKISIADMSAIVELLVNQYPETTPPYTCYPVPNYLLHMDVNLDGKISIADMAAIVSFLSPAYKDTTPPYTYIGCMP